MGCLYKLEFPNGKSYVGISAKKTPTPRFKEHCYIASDTSLRNGSAVHKAIHKYGTDKVIVTTLASNLDWEALQLVETLAIEKFESFGPRGYNMTLGGDGSVGYKHTRDSLLKMGAVHKGCAHHTTPHSDAAKAKMSLAKLGKKRPADHCENIRKSLLGNKRLVGYVQSPEHVLNRVIGMLRSAKGVSFDKRNSKWRAYICLDQSMCNLGRFATEAEAVIVRKQAVDAAIERLTS